MQEYRLKTDGIVSYSLTYINRFVETVLLKLTVTIAINPEK